MIQALPLVVEVEEALDLKQSMKSRRSGCDLQPRSLQERAVVRVCFVLLRAEELAVALAETVLLGEMPIWKADRLVHLVGEACRL